MGREVITEQVIISFLRSYLVTLTGSELISLRNGIVCSTSVEELPVQLRENLHLNKFLLRRNLHQIILEKFDVLVRERCLLPGLLSKEELKWTSSYINNKYRRYFQDAAWKSYTAESNRGGTTGIVEDYAHFLLEHSLAGCNTSVNTDGTGPARIFVEAPIIRVSSIKQNIQEQLQLLGQREREVLLVGNIAIYIDADLSNDIWHGTHVIIWTKRLECVYKHCWDMSGIRCLENGGNFAAICKEFVTMNNFSVTSNGNTCANQRPVDGENYTNTLLTSFPPSGSSDDLRRLVAENAMALGGAGSRILCEPTYAIDQNRKRVTGDINEFYMEGELHNGLKYFVWFGKGSGSNGMSFCLIQDNKARKCSTNYGSGTGGVVTFAYAHDALIPIPHDKLGVNVSSKSTLTKGKKISLGQDIGYMQFSARKIIKYPPGNYNVVFEDFRKDKCMFSKVVGKWISIRKRTKLSANPASSSMSLGREPSEENLLISVALTAMRKRTTSPVNSVDEVEHLLESHDSSEEKLLISVALRYDHLTKRIQTDDNIATDSLLSVRQSDWWIGKILKLN